MNELMQFAHTMLYPSAPSVSLEATDPRVEGFVRGRGGAPEQFARVSITGTDDAAVNYAGAVLDDIQAVVLVPATLDGVLRSIGCREDRLGGYPAVVVDDWRGDRVAYCGTRGPEVVSGSVIPDEFAEVASSLETVYAFIPGCPAD